ncbi:MAG TPA: M20/M25/M40 family metallo-hydrolase, partial [Anaerolineales bacterium]|nr:M20/M25/M40 family metallo-hydrolase [Anaerolineales bacterium]
MSANVFVPEDMQQELLRFTQTLVRTKSLSGQEGAVIKLVEKKMLDLGYDEVKIDSMGNIIGRIGNGAKSIMFDSHVDTVEVKDEAEWNIPPFSGEIVDGRLHGRGSVDMKSAVAASIYAGALAKQMG